MDPRRPVSALRLSAAALLAAFAGGVVPGCSCGGETGNPGGTGGAGGAEPAQGGAGPSTSTGGGGGGGGGSTLCGPGVANCEATSFGPSGKPPGEFPLPEDEPKPEGVLADGVVEDEDGYLGLGTTKAAADNLWVANDKNYGAGTVSKIRTTPFDTAPFYREIARYATVTCHSNPEGSKEGASFGRPPPEALCADGVSGCCVRDDAGGGKANGLQPVNLVANRPSRTAVDFNGDVWVANRAHGRQGSVTKIAADKSHCVDRNGSGAIDTSEDKNGDGIITTDCNDDNVADDASTVCAEGKAHEFYGLDDECVLFTVNVGGPGELARPLALQPSTKDQYPPAPSDAWAGAHETGTFYKVDGETGKVVKAVVLQPQKGIAPRPYGAAIDRFGILWAPNASTKALFYFDTKDASKQGMVEATTDGHGFYGIALDGYVEGSGEFAESIQQVWLGEVSGSGAFRYRPDRKNGFEGLKNGSWAHVAFDGGVAQGRGIGVDNRGPSFAWVALDGYVTQTGGAIGRIPIDVPDGTSTLLGAEHVFDTQQSGTLGAGVATDLDVWGINQGSSSATHLKVDAQGAIVGPPDTVPLDDKPGSPEEFCELPSEGQCKPHPYTYSDFTGFGLRNFTAPAGAYALTLTACEGEGKPLWHAVHWVADEPEGTDVRVSVRSADTVEGLQSATFTGAYTDSPAKLDEAPGPLAPNPARFVQVRFELTTSSDTSPKLKGFQVAYVCEPETGTPK